MSGKNTINNYYSSNNNDNHKTSRQRESSNQDDNNNTGKPLAKLLVVDDDPDIVQVLKLGLEQNRFLIDAFTNPEEALQSFKSNAESYVWWCLTSECQVCRVFN